MNFKKHLKELAESLLESTEGCTARQFSALLSLIQFFEYSLLAANLSANAFACKNKYKCSAGTVEAIFKKYC